MASISRTHDQKKILSFLEGIAKAQSEINFREIVLKLLSDLFGFDHAAFFLIDKKSLATCFPVYSNITTTILNTWWNDHLVNDIFYSAFKEVDLFAKKLYVVEDLMSAEAYEQTVYYREVMSKLGFWDCAALSLETSDDIAGVLGINREKKDGPFTAEEKELLTLLNGHIAKALDTYLLISRFRSEDQFFQTAFNELHEGIILLGPDNAVLRANKIAERMCGDMFADESFNAVQRFVNSMANRIYAKAAPSQASIELESETLHIRVVPVLLASPLHSMEHRSVVYLTEKCAGGDDAFCKLSKAYRLSERESEIVKLVAEGRDNNEIAQSLFLSHHTVKTHMQNIFKKLGINSRNAVTRRLSEIGKSKP